MINVYGLKVSYFTGKLEGYLRYKEIPYAFHPATAEYFNRIFPEKVGAAQVPAVELEDGRWMSDTSPIITWFETQHCNHPILPEDPVQAFLCHLIEDYADEWLWRPAMHYRWSYPTSSKLLRRQITDEIAREVPAPNWLLRRRIERRQHLNFVKRDGVRQETWAHVERGYLKLLEILTPIFENRPFLFGSAPTLADIGLFGPLFRHFSMDPVPAVIMRETAPAVMEWVYRLWNTKASEIDRQFVDGCPADLFPLLEEAGATHLENLNAVAQAWSNQQNTYEVTIQDTDYVNLPVSQYRVWCLEQLQKRFEAIEGNAKGDLEDLLQAQGCLEPLLRTKNLSSGYDQAGEAPFGRSITVYRDIKG